MPQVVLLPEKWFNHTVAHKYLSQLIEKQPVVILNHSTLTILTLHTITTNLTGSVVCFIVAK
jgi:hypothetical protein